jgi:mannosyltransferase OCH1-like enzyme
MPPGMRRTVDAVRAMNPDFQVRFFDEAACRGYIQEHFPPAVLNAYDALIPLAYKSDLWRYCILWREGGVYLDIKMEPLKPFRELLRAGPIVVRDLEEWCKGGIWNGCIAVPPGHPGLKRCIDEIVAAHAQRSMGASVLDITGPCLLGRVMGPLARDSPFELRVRPNGVHRVIEILGWGEPVLREYAEYRRDQRSGQAHYGELYKRGMVWKH